MPSNYLWNYAPTVPNVAKVYFVTARCEKSRNYTGFLAGPYLLASDLTYAATLITVKRAHSSILKRAIFTSLCFFEAKDNGRKFINTHQLQELLLEADAELSPVYWDHYKKVQGAEDAEQSPEYCFSCCVYFKCVLRILR